MPMQHRKNETDFGSGSVAPNPPPATRPSTASASASALGGVGSMGARVVFIESPARLLHEQLSSHFEASDVASDRLWPGVGRIGFIVGAALGLWTLIGGLAVLSI